MKKFNKLTQFVGGFIGGYIITSIALAMFSSILAKDKTLVQSGNLDEINVEYESV